MFKLYCPSTTHKTKMIRYTTDYTHTESYNLWIYLDNDENNRIIE